MPSTDAILAQTGGCDGSCGVPMTGGSSESPVVEISGGAKRKTTKAATKTKSKSKPKSEPKKPKSGKKTRKGGAELTVVDTVLPVDSPSTVAPSFSGDNLGFMMKGGKSVDDDGSELFNLLSGRGGGKRGGNNGIVVESIRPVSGGRTSRKGGKCCGAEIGGGSAAVESVESNLTFGMRGGEEPVVEGGAKRGRGRPRKSENVSKAVPKKEKKPRQKRTSGGAADLFENAIKALSAELGKHV